ncbi:single-stranded DNA-binding protein [Candidatus Gottesmanbacteria bacterium]|nr:single-stranded DNA-binding protein [Candidatus Gottesmanbacteria bacterium]
MARSLNKVQLIGNLTRDPELRYTPSGAAVCTIGLATNRYWTTESGEKKEEVEFHRVVAWNKLAELCSQLLAKGRKVYVEGRLRTAAWQAADGSQRTTTEIVIEDMILLDSRLPAGQAGIPAAVGAGSKAASSDTPSDGGSAPPPTQPASGGTKKSVAQPDVKPADDAKEDVNPDDIPF